MSRRRTLVPLAAGGALALALIPAVPASAATITWSQAGDSWWTTAAWSPVPAAGDHVVFDGGPRSTYNIGGGSTATVFDGFTFAADHLIANGGGVIGIGASGIALEPGVTAQIDLDIRTTGAQTWTIPADATLTIPTWITTDGAGTLTFAVDGVLNIEGNVDGAVTGAVVQTGSGTVVRTGATGGMIAGGYRVEGGTFLVAGAVIESTPVTVAGGTVEGAGLVGHLAVENGDLALRTEVTPWGLLVTDSTDFAGGTFLVSADADSGASDQVQAVAGPITGAGTVLQVELTGTPTLGDAFVVVRAAVDGSIDPALRFLSPAGDPIEDGAHFDSNGHRWLMTYAAGPGGFVEIEYGGPTPAEEEEETPTVPAEDGEDDDPRLPATGSAPTGLLVAAAALFGGAGLLFAIGAARGRRRRARV